jgi:hypothetical protein
LTAKNVSGILIAMQYVIAKSLKTKPVHNRAGFEWLLSEMMN